jgi:hypothetical protein
MNRLVVILTLAAVLQMPAVTAGEAADWYPDVRQSGRINDRRVVEASGLARSHRVADRLWTMNDGGSRPQLFAVGTDGRIQGSMSLRQAANIDWEDLASFEQDGKAWLLVADIGDNEAKRHDYTLYVVEEPAVLKPPSTLPSRVIHFTYPDGPLDAESVAVDCATNSIFVLVKRTVPARLYRVPLSGDDGAATQTAELLGNVASLPQPSQRELDRALADQSWHWQPTAMDFAQNDRTAVILTYRGVYIYPRAGGESWFDALQRQPQSLSLGAIRLAEAIAFGSDDSIFITVEGRKPWLYRLDPQP